MTRPTLYPVILSGGAGTRLWPASRVSRPKQFLSFYDDITMIQATAQRAGGVSGDVSFAAPIVVCNAIHRDQVAAQLDEAGTPAAAILLEPMARNTAPAAAAVAAYIEETDPGALVLLTPADQHMGDVKDFHAACSRAVDAANAGAIVTFGVTPTSAHTGYGYIQRGAEANGAYAVKRFIEKPDPETAASHLASGDYFWNAGIFLFRCDALVREMRQHCPEVLDAARSAVEKASREEGALFLDGDAFATAPSVSIDYAVMEKTANAAVTPLTSAWTDLGSWSAVWEFADKDADGNTSHGEAVFLGAKNTLAYSDGPLVTAIGVEDLVVVATKDAVLVCPRSDTQKVKQIVEQLKENARKDIL